MKALLQFPRTLYNVLFLRGRRRVTKLLLLLVLGGLVMAVVKEGVCTVHPELCQNGDIHPDMFQSVHFQGDRNAAPRLRIDPHSSRTLAHSIKEGNEMKSRLAEEWKAAGKLQDNDKLGVNHQDNRQERLEAGGHRLEREEEEVQDRGDESQDNGDARDRPDDLQEGEDGPAVPIPGDQAGLPQPNPLNEAVRSQTLPSNNQDPLNSEQNQQLPGAPVLPGAQFLAQTPGALPGVPDQVPGLSSPLGGVPAQQPGVLTVNKDVNQPQTMQQVPGMSSPLGGVPVQQPRVLMLNSDMIQGQTKQQQVVKNPASQLVAQPVPSIPQTPAPLNARRAIVPRTIQTDAPTLPLPGMRMSAEEVAKAIRNGQMCKTVCPPFVWSEWSPCSKACGQGRRYRKAIYDFVCQASDKCPLNRIEESICDVPCKFDPDKYGGPGGLDMYPINPLNPPMYPEDSKYMCGHWLVEYEKLHKDIITGKRPPAYLVYSTGKGDYPTAGGIAGRIRGITTVFFMAVLLERAFLVEWEDPPGLEEYLEPKGFNWADLTPIQRLKRGPMRDIGSWRSAKDSGRSSQWYMNTNFTKYFTNPVEVVQGHRYDFTYAVLRNQGLMPKAYELGIDRIKCRICCAWDMLFKMTSKFQKEMDALLKSLGVPSKSLMTIQARSRSDDIQAAVALSEQYVSCAMKAGKELKLSSRMVWVPVFNNRLVVHIVAKKYASKMKTPIHIDTATRTVHTHLGNLPPDTEVNVLKGVQERSFKEFFLMMNSTVIIRTKGYVGSFGNIADAIRRFYAERGTIYTYTAGGGCTRFPDNYKIE